MYTIQGPSIRRDPFMLIPISLLLLSCSGAPHIIVNTILRSFNHTLLWRASNPAHTSKNHTAFFSSCRSLSLFVVWHYYTTDGDFRPI